MKKPEEDRKVGIEGWIDERIQLALSGLAHPFEKRIAQLRQRIENLRARVQQLSSQIEEDSRKGREGAEKRPGEEEP
jgi:polyhydroxyalkanoate synthesis regulator phasin